MPTAMNNCDCIYCLQHTAMKLDVIISCGVCSLPHNSVRNANGLKEITNFVPFP